MMVGWQVWLDTAPYSFFPHGLLVQDASQRVCKDDFEHVNHQTFDETRFQIVLGHVQCAGQGICDLAKLSEISDVA